MTNAVHKKFEQSRRNQLHLQAQLDAFPVMGYNVAREVVMHVECLDGDGNLKWEETFTHLIVNVGLDDSLDKHLKGSAYTAAWYVFLISGTPTVAAGDTSSSHVGWTEVTAYTEANRQALTLGTVSGQSVDNSASKASFSINANGTVIGGAGVANSNTKGSTTDTYYGVGAFTGGNKTADNGDTLNVTATCTAASA